MSSLQAKWLRIHVGMRLVEVKPSASKQSPLYLKADQVSRYCARLIYLLNHFQFYYYFFLIIYLFKFLFSSQPVIAQIIISGMVKNAAHAQVAPLGLV